MENVLTAFGLGNAAILTNACMLPLYPGLIAFLAGTQQGSESRGKRATALLGVLVLAGILTMMLALGLLLVSIANLLQVILPVVYAFVIVMGLLLFSGRNPFARLTTAQSPVLRNPYLTAYGYGLLLGPMTLPCTGPVIATAFVYSAGTTYTLADGIAYFLAFGLGFGWPLVVLPALAMPVQQRMVRWLAQHHVTLNRAAGVLLIAVGVFGVFTELLPRYLSSLPLLDTVVTDPAFWTVYWMVIAALIGVIVITGVRKRAAHHGQP